MGAGLGGAAGCEGLGGERQAVSGGDTQANKTLDTLTEHTSGITKAWREGRKAWEAD